MPVRTGRMVPRTSEKGKGAGPRRQFRQCQCLHRQERTGRLQVHCANRLSCGWLQTRGCLSGIDGCDRRTAQGAGFRRRDGRPSCPRTGWRFSRRRARDHDHGHVSESRDRDRKNRQSNRNDQWHCQRRRHDRAGYGDHAVFRFHGRGDFRARSSVAAERWRRPIRSMP